MGFGVWGLRLGFGIWDLRLGFWFNFWGGLGFGMRVQSSGWRNERTAAHGGAEDGGNYLIKPVDSHFFDLDSSQLWGKGAHCG